MELIEALSLKPHETTQKLTPKRIARQQKQDEFITKLFNGHYTVTRLAKEFGISRHTAYEWFNQWKQREHEQVDIEWWSLYYALKQENPDHAFDGLTRLKYRMTPDKIEASTTHTERLITVQLSAKILRNETCLSNPESQSTTNHTINKPNSIKDATPTVTEQPSQA